MGASDSGGFVAPNENEFVGQLDVVVAGVVDAASKVLVPKIGLLFVFAADDAPAALLPNTNGAADGGVEEELIVEMGIASDVVDTAAVAGAENNVVAGFEPNREDVAWADGAEDEVAAADAAAPKSEVVAGLPKTKPVVELLTVAVDAAVAAAAAAAGVAEMAPNRGVAVALFEDTLAPAPAPNKEPLDGDGSLPKEKPVVEGVVEAATFGVPNAEGAAAVVAPVVGLPKTNPLLGVDVLTALDAVLALPNVTFGGDLLFASDAFAAGALKVMGLMAAAGVDDDPDPDPDAGIPKSKPFVSAGLAASSPPAVAFLKPPKADWGVGLKSDDVAGVVVVEVTAELALLSAGEAVEAGVSFVADATVAGLRPKLKPVEVVVSDLLLAAAAADEDEDDDDGTPNLKPAVVLVFTTSGTSLEVVFA